MLCSRLDMCNVLTYLQESEITVSINILCTDITAVSSISSRLSLCSNSLIILSACTNFSVKFSEFDTSAAALGRNMKSYKKYFRVNILWLIRTIAIYRMFVPYEVVLKVQTTQSMHGTSSEAA